MSPMPAPAQLNWLQQRQHLLVRPPVLVKTSSRRPGLRVGPRAAVPAFDVEIGNGSNGVRPPLCTTVTVVQARLW